MAGYKNGYLHNLIGAVEEELHSDKNSRDDHGGDDCACHSDDHVFPGRARLLPVSITFRLK